MKPGFASSSVASTTPPPLNRFLTLDIKDSLCFTEIVRFRTFVLKRRRLLRLIKHSDLERPRLSNRLCQPPSRASDNEYSIPLAMKTRSCSFRETLTYHLILRLARFRLHYRSQSGCLSLKPCTSYLRSRRCVIRENHT